MSLKDIDGKLKPMLSGKNELEMLFDTGSTYTWLPLRFWN